VIKRLNYFGYSKLVLIFQRDIVFLVVIVAIFGGLLTPVLSIDFATATSGINDSFSAIGQIASLVITVPDSDFNITDAFKVILTGEWNLSVRNGTVTNFNVDFAASPMDGRGPHIHQIPNFKPYNNEQPIVLTKDESVMINGTADINYTLAYNNS
jgi:hypothetical protein